ncbi:MAG: hypothetical protein AAF462_00325 [Thermodesulfobacteriota bacterium]
MAVLCNDTQKVYSLSSSNIGNVSQCSCCDSFHVAIGNITLRMERKHLISLTQMIIEALEVKSINENTYPDIYVRNQAQ